MSSTLRGKGSIMAGPKRQYDSIRRLEFLSGKARDFFLLGATEQIIRTYKGGATTYVDKFKDDTRNSRMIGYLNSKYNLSSDPEELILETDLGELVGFDSILAAHRSKVVYVDFWASWCAACIRSLPAIKALQAHFRHDNVVFIFISIDEKRDNWIDARRKYSLERDSYLANNHYAASFLAEIQFQEIPRYLLFGPSGQLIDSQAPPPDDKRLKGMIASQLAGL